MRSKLAGYALQLAGYAMVFLGLGVATAALFVAGFFPAAPLWIFIAVGVVLGAPLMLAGGWLYNRGRVLLGTPVEQVEAEHRAGTATFARLVLLVWLMGLWCAAPLFVRATGLANPNDAIVSLWVAVWMLAFTAGARWTTQPLWYAIERGFSSHPQRRSGGSPWRPPHVQK